MDIFLKRIALAFDPHLTHLLQPPVQNITRVAPAKPEKEYKFVTSGPKCRSLFLPSTESILRVIILFINLF